MLEEASEDELPETHVIKRGMGISYGKQKTKGRNKGKQILHQYKEELSCS